MFGVADMAQLTSSESAEESLSDSDEDAHHTGKASTGTHISNKAS